MNVIVVGSTYKQAKEKLLSIITDNCYVFSSKESCSVYNNEDYYKSFTIDSIKRVRGQQADVLYITDCVTFDDMVIIIGLVSHGREIDVRFY